MAEEFTLKFGLDVTARRESRSGMSPEAREQAFARDQIQILLRYLTLYENGRALNPDSFSIVNAPDRIIDLNPGTQV